MKPGRTMKPGMEERLEELLVSVDPSTRSLKDPVRFVHRYTSPQDQEIAGLLASGLAYGKVSSFSPVISKLLDLADEHGGPRAWVDSFTEDRDAADLRPLYYRFNRGDDFVYLLLGLRQVLESHGSIGSLVQPRQGEGDVGAALSRMVQVLREAVLRAHPAAEGFGQLSRGLRYFLVDPADGSASKRLLMYARWMVRADAVDVGAWGHLSPSLLVMPVDTHVHRISRMLGLTKRTSADWKTARELTLVFRQLDPDDPIRYDFALAHVGISQGCTGRPSQACAGCALRSVCTVVADR